MPDKTTSNLILRPLNDTDVTTWELPEGAITRLGRGRLVNISFSPDGKYLAVATPIGCWLYDLPTLTPRSLIETERGMLTKIAFSRDGRWIATGNADGIVKVWDTDTSQCLAKIDYHKIMGGPLGYCDLNFSEDGKYLAVSSSSGCAVFTWHTNTDEPIAQFSIDAADTNGKRVPIYLSPNRNMFAYVSSVSPMTTIMIKDIDTGEHITDYSCPALYAFTGLVFSPCGQYLASVHQNGNVQVRNIDNATSEIVHTLSDATSVRLAYTSVGALRIAEIHEEKVVIWDTEQFQKVGTLEFERHGRKIFRFSDDGTHFVIANSREFQVWRDGGLIKVVSMSAAHIGIIRWVRFSQQKKTLISGHGPSNMFWSLEDHQLQHIFYPKTEGYFLGRSSVLSPCEESLATPILGIRNSNDIAITIWHITSGTLIAEMTGHERHVVQMAYSPSGDFLVSASSLGELIVWDTQFWEKRHELIGHTKDITSVFFHPDGKQLVTASNDRTARVWNVENGEQVGSLPLDTIIKDISLYRGGSQEIQALIKWKQQLESEQSTDQTICSDIRFSPCGTLIAGRLYRRGKWKKKMANEIRLWDAATLEIRMTILLPADDSLTRALTFSPCSRYLASGTWWKKGLEKMRIRLWEVASGENIATFWGHPTDIHDLAFSPDGSLLASGSYDGTILLWDMKPFINS